MKKTGLFLLSAGFAALMFASCEQYTPMTAEQLEEKATAAFEEQVGELTATKTSECAESMQASVDAKVEELKTAAAAVQ